MTPRLGRGYSVETSRGDAAAATRIVCGGESRRRHGWVAEVSTGARRRYKLNQSTNVINASKVGEKAHGDLKRTVSS